MTNALKPFESKNQRAERGAHFAGMVAGHDEIRINRVDNFSLTSKPTQKYDFHCERR